MIFCATLRRLASIDAAPEFRLQKGVLAALT
jgi:hypothetical protein